MSKISVRVEYGVGAFTASPSGRDVALATRAGLYIVDLQDPFSPPRWLPLRTLWEVADVQWSPHPNHPSWVISTSNQKLILWDLGLPSSNAIEQVLHGHRRAVTDINFNNSRPDIVASCSIDTYVHVWDLRDPLRPSLSFADFRAGAAQVKWSKTRSHMLASAHDNRLLIWDDRKNNIPLHSFDAHLGRINGVDFDRQGSSQFMTCSTDRTTKVWDLNDLENKSPVLTINSTFPVWRSRYLPEGSGCVMIPLRGGQDAGYLLDLSRHKKGATIPLQPVRSFLEHAGPIKDVSMRREGNGYDLLTWSTDNNLKVWTMDSESLNAVNCSFNLLPTARRDVTYHMSPVDSHKHGLRRGFFKLDPEFMPESDKHIDWIAGVTVGNNEAVAPAAKFASPGGTENAQTDPSVTFADSLSKEVTSVGSRFPKIKFEDIDIYTGHCVLVLRGPWGPEEELVLLRLSLRFPRDYPYAPLKCHIEEDPSVGASTIAYLEEYLHKYSQRLAEHGEQALEYCLRFLMGDEIPIEAILNREKQVDTAVPGLTSAMYDSSDDEYGMGNDEKHYHDHYHDEKYCDPDCVVHGPGTFDADFSTKSKIDTTPLPKTCGARWCKDGRLLCFFNRTAKELGTSGADSLGKLFAGEQSDDESDLYESDSDDFEVGPAGKHWLLAGTTLAPKARVPVQEAGTVSVSATVEDTMSVASIRGTNTVRFLDFNDIMPCRPDIAVEYWVDLYHTAEEMAIHNSAVARKYGRREDAYLWNLVANFSRMSEAYDPVENRFLDRSAPPNVFFEWAGHPFSTTSEMGTAIFKYLEKSHNVQMMASVACVLGKAIRPILARSRPHWHRESSGKLMTFLPFTDSDYVVERKQNKLVVSLEHHSGARLSDQTLWREKSERLELPSLFRDAEVVRQLTSDKVDLTGDHGPDRTFYDSEGTISVSPCEGRRDSAFLPMTVGINAPSPQNGHGSTEIPEIPNTAATSNSGEHGFAFHVRLFNPVQYDREFLAEDMGISTDFFKACTRAVGRFRAHRATYANLLGAWGLDIQRLEMLKYNYTAHYRQGEENQFTEKAPSTLGKQSEVLIDSGNNFSGDSNSIPPEDPASPVTETTTTTCTFCNLTVRTQFCQCPNCTHIMHRKCAEQWWDMGTECSKGCGCRCLDFSL